MIDSGVDIVAGVKGELFVKVLNRYAACELVPLGISVIGVEFESCDEQGSVYFKIRFGLLETFFAEVVYKIELDIIAGSLVVSVDEESIPAVMQEKLQSITDNSPYILELDQVSEYIGLVDCGLKVGGLHQDLLLIGAEVSQGQGSNWNRFYNNYSGSDLISGSDLWAVYAKKYPVERVFRDMFSEVLGQGDLDGIDNMEITNIEWPGDRIEVSLKGTYTDCDIFSEIDFRTKAAVTFPVEGSKLYAEARLHDMWLPEEDLIQAGICSLSGLDIIASLLTGFVYLLGKIVTEILNTEDEVLKKELLYLRYPEIDSIGLNSATATSTGVVVRGVGPSEVGSGQLYLWDGSHVGKIELTKSIKVPLGYIGHPYEPIFRSVLLQNHGQASLIICSAEIEPNFDLNLGSFQIISTESGEGCIGPYQTYRVDKKMFLLPIEKVYDPYSRTYLKIGFNPTNLTSYDTLYEATLILNTIIVVADELGEITYVPHEERIELTAKYSWYNREMQTLEPGFLMDKGDILIDVYLDKPFIDIFDIDPWIDLPYPEGTIKTAEIYTMDPVVSGLQIQNSKGLVVENTSSLPMKYISFNMQEETDFTLLVESDDPIDPEPHTRDAHPRKRTLLNLAGYAYIPQSRIELEEPVQNIQLSSGKLYIMLEQEIQVYDVTDITKPVQLVKKQVKGKLESFTILPTQMKTGEIMCFTDTGSDLYTLALTPGKSRVSLRKAQVTFGDVKSSFKAKLLNKKIFLFDPDGFSVYGVRKNELKSLSYCSVGRRVYDGDARGRTVVVGTDEGIEVYSVNKVSQARRIIEYRIGHPVRKVKIKGPYIYVETEKETLLLEFNQPEKLSQAGVYSGKQYDFDAIKGRDLYIAQATNRNTIVQYKKQRMPPDITRYLKPKRQPNK